MRQIFADEIMVLLYRIRQLLGMPGACIFPEQTCLQFTRHQLHTARWYYALPAIAWRVIRCNPLTLLVRRLHAAFRQSRD